MNAAAAPVGGAAVGLQSHDPSRARLTNSNMVASLAGLRFLLMILLFCGIRYGACSQEAPPVLGLRLEDPVGLVCMKDRIISAPEGATFTLRLFGADLNGSWPWVAFAWAAGGATEAVGDAPDPCEQDSNRQKSAFQVTGNFTPDGGHSGLITVEVKQSSISAGDGEQTFHHLCVESGGRWTSVGLDRLRVDTGRGPPADYIPPWGLAVLVVLLLVVCGVLRTVNLSLLWLDPVELYVLHSCGSEEEKRAAKRLQPVRRRGNFLVRFCEPKQGPGLHNRVIQILIFWSFWFFKTGSGFICSRFKSSNPETFRSAAGSPPRRFSVNHTHEYMFNCFLIYDETLLEFVR